VRVRYKLRLARVDGTSLGIDGMSEGGRRALLDDLHAAPSASDELNLMTGLF
jgi:hypothetical protein